MTKYRIRGIRIVKKKMNRSRIINEYEQNIFQHIDVYYICLEDSMERLFELELYECYAVLRMYENDGMYAERDFNMVDYFRKFDYVPKKFAYIDFDHNDDDYECKYFSYSYNGGSNYYPEGYVIINLNLFSPVKKNK